MTLWLVRAGSQGEQEAGALKYNVVTIGWNDIPPLSDINSKEQLKQLYYNSHPYVKKMHAAKVVGQIWDFAKQIKTGDIVALPLKSHRAIALGKVEGGYEYRELAPTIKHTIPVKWLKMISRDQFDQDLLYSLGSLMTVCQIERNDAEARIKHLIENVEVDKTAKGGLMTILEDQKPTNNLNDKQLTYIIKEFKVWLISDPGQKLKKIVLEEKHEVRKIMKNLETLDKQSDRWIISSNKCFNVPSPDVVARGQYSEVKNTENRPPFEEWWNVSLDLITHYDQIERKIQEYQNTI